MIKSKFKFRAIIHCFLVLLLLGILLLIITSTFIGFILPLPPIFFALIFILFWIVILWGEFRTRMVLITIDDNSISSQNYIGLGKKKQFDFKSLKGFKVSNLTSHRGNSEYLYLLLDNKKVIKISEYHHSNYTELKRIIATKTKNLGFESFKWIDEFKEYFI